MEATVEKLLQGITPGEVTLVEGLAVVPLFSDRAGMLDYVTLNAAISTSSVSVREVDASGSVAELLVSNNAASMVLALDGEELEGAKQNRILNTSVLLPGEGEMVIPVSCTEQGRWAYVSREFKASDSFATPRIRESAKRSVNRALDEDRGFRANQGDIWDGVARLSREAGIHSPTSAMSDVVKARLPDLDRVTEAVPAQQGQCGLLVAAGGQVLGFDLVSRPDAYAQLHRRLLRSYLVETSSTPRRAGALDLTAAIEAFLRAAAGAEERHFKSVGLGDDYRYEGTHIVGSALVHDDEVVHAAFFSTPAEETFGRAAETRSMRTRARFHRDSATRDQP